MSALLPMRVRASLACWILSKVDLCFFRRWVVLMDILDESFDGLREYDLIYNIDKVHSMFDEVIMGGLVLETNVDKIMATINAKNSLEYKMEDSSGRLPTVK